MDEEGMNTRGYRKAEESETKTTCNVCGGYEQVMDVDISSGTPYMHDCPRCKQ